MTVHPAVVIVLAVLTAALKAWGLWLTDRRVRHDREGRQRSLFDEAAS